MIDGQSILTGFDPNGDIYYVRETDRSCETVYDIKAATRYIKTESRRAISENSINREYRSDFSKRWELRWMPDLSMNDQVLELINL